MAGRFVTHAGAERRCTSVPIRRRLTFSPSEEVDTYMDTLDETPGCWIVIEGIAVKLRSLIRYRDPYAYIYVSYISLKPRGNDTPGTVSISKPQILVSKYHS